MEKKECFAILDRVFPVGEEGFRETTPECFQCPDRVTCLKEALTSREGIEMRAEILDRSPASGIVGKIRRWSQRKELSRLASQDKKKRK